MEWALYIPRTEKLHLYKDSWQENNVFNGKFIKEMVNSLEGQIRFTRMYFGEEFCERTIPSLPDVQKGVQFAKEHGLEFTLVTPYVTESGLRRLKTVFQGLLEGGQQYEVVVNDWGVLFLISKEYPGLIPVIGRQLNKAWRDPRFKDPSIPISSLQSDAIKGIFKEMKVNRLEFDIPPQGLKYLERQEFEQSLYFPYTVITSGRMCLIGSWGLDKCQKFKATDDTCNYYCRKYWLELSDKSRQIPKSKERKIVQKGNAIFCVYNENFLTSNLRIAIEKGVNRMIFQPEPK